MPWVFETTLVGPIPQPRPCRASFSNILVPAELKGVLKEDKDLLRIFRQKCLLYVYENRAISARGKFETKFVYIQQIKTVLILQAKNLTLKYMGLKVDDNVEV